MVLIYNVLADPANVSLLKSPVDVANECTMYQEIWISWQSYIVWISMDKLISLWTLVIKLAVCYAW